MEEIKDVCEEIIKKYGIEIEVDENVGEKPLQEVVIEAEGEVVVQER